MTSTRNVARRKARRSRSRRGQLDPRWKSYLTGDNPSESQLIAIMVAILAGRPLSELAEDSRP